MRHRQHIAEMQDPFETLGRALTLTPCSSLSNADLNKATRVSGLYHLDISHYTKPQQIYLSVSSAIAFCFQDLFRRSKRSIHLALDAREKVSWAVCILSCCIHRHPRQPTWYTLGTHEIANVLLQVLKEACIGLIREATSLLCINISTRLSPTG